MDTRPRGIWSALRDTTFRSLRHRDYRRYFYGQIVSFTGSWMQSAALMWLMYDRTGDPRWPSWLLVAQVGPTLLLGAWGGHLADRFPKRDLVIRTQTAFLVNAVLLAATVALDFAVPWLVLLLMAMNGVIQAIDLPARLAFVPDLVPREDLINAVGLNSLLFNSARAVGPAIAGLFFVLANQVTTGRDAVTLGAACCFSLNALSFLAVLVALRGIHCAEHAPAASNGTAWDGLTYLRRNRTLAALVLLTLVVCVFGWPVLTLLPAYTRTHLGKAEQSYSVLVSALGAGALVGALATATFGAPHRRRYFLLAGVSVLAGGMFGLALAAERAEAAACCGCVGFGLVLFLSTGQSTLQLAVPDDKRGRVMALWAMTLSASAPLGHLIAGHSAAAFGVTPVLKGMALGAALSAGLLAGVVLRGLRK